MNEPKSGQRFDLCATLEEMVESPTGEFALASDLDAALDLLDEAAGAIDEACYTVWWERYRAFLTTQELKP